MAKVKLGYPPQLLSILLSKTGSSTGFQLRDSARLLVSDFRIPGYKHVPLYPALYVGAKDANSGLMFMQQAIYPLNFLLRSIFIFSLQVKKLQIKKDVVQTPQTGFELNHNNTKKKKTY